MFSGLKASYLPPRNSNPPVQDAVWMPVGTVHGYLAPADYDLLKSCAKLLGFVLRRGSNPNSPTPGNTDGSLSAECCFALLVQRGKFARGLVPRDMFNVLKERHRSSPVSGARA